MVCHETLVIFSWTWAHFSFALFVARHGHVFEVCYLFVNIFVFLFHCVFDKSSKLVNLFLGQMIRAFGFFFAIFARFLCFSASYFKVRHFLVLCVGLCPCSMQKCFLSLSLLSRRCFLLPFSCPDVLLDLSSMTGSSNADSRR